MKLRIYELIKNSPVLAPRVDQYPVGLVVRHAPSDHLDRVAAERLARPVLIHRVALELLKVLVDDHGGQDRPVRHDLALNVGHILGRNGEGLLAATHVPLVLARVARLTPSLTLVRLLLLQALFSILKNNI
jgi:hypothetical protein